MRTRRQSLPVFIISTVLSIALVYPVAAVENVAATVKKPAWDWTLDERLAARSAITKAAPEGRIKGLTDNSNNVGTIEFAIDGRKNPELFFTYELFDGILDGFHPDEMLRAKQRGFYAPYLRPFGYGDNAFWSALHSISSAYLPYRFGSSPATREEARQWDFDKCRARYEALEAARRLFGRREFDRLLYVVIGKNTQFAGAGGGSASEYVDKLRRAEEGCK